MLAFVLSAAPLSAISLEVSSLLLSDSTPQPGTEPGEALSKDTYS